MSDLFRIALDTSIRIGFVSICLGAIMAVTRVRSGAVRHAGWTAVLCAMLLMPVLTSLTPVIGIPVEAHFMDWRIDTQAPLGPVMESGRRQNPSIEASQPSPRTVSHAPLWPAAAFVVYLAGLLLLLSRMAAGWYSTRLLIAAAVPVDSRVWESADIAAPLIVGG